MQYGMAFNTSIVLNFSKLILKLAFLLRKLHLIMKKRINTRLDFNSSNSFLSIRDNRFPVKLPILSFIRSPSFVFSWPHFQLIVAAQSNDLFSQILIEIRIIDIDDNSIEMLNRELYLNIREDEALGTHFFDSEKSL